MRKSGARPMTAEGMERLRQWTGYGNDGLLAVRAVRRELKCAALDAVGVVEASGLAYNLKSSGSVDLKKARRRMDVAQGAAMAERWRQDPELWRLEAEIEGFEPTPDTGPKP